MVAAALIPWLDPEILITTVGPWAVVVVCAIVFAETGLLVGFILPGDSLLIVTGVLAFSGVIGLNVWLVALAIGVAAFLGGELGYLIGKTAGPRIFERRESGLFSKANVDRTNAFFVRYGAAAVIIARFVPIVRSFAPVAAGVARMNPRTYSLFNLIGALLWATGLTLVGYLLGYVPPVRDFILAHTDLIIICAVLIAVVPVGINLLMSSRRSKRAARAADAGAEAVGTGGSVDPGNPGVSP